MKTRVSRDNRFDLRVRSQSAIRDLAHLLVVLLHKQLYRDMELTVSNEPVKHATGLTDLHQVLKSSERFDGNLSFDTVESPIRNPDSHTECVAGSVNCIGDSSLVPLPFHCKEGFVDRRGEFDQIFLLACVRYGLLQNVKIDPVDMNVNEAGMRLSSRVTGWSGETCKAGTDSASAFTPRAWQRWWLSFCAAQDRMDETVVSVEDAEVEATIVTFDASGVVQSMLLAEGYAVVKAMQQGQADAMETTENPVVLNMKGTLSCCEPCERQRMTTTVL